NTMHSSWLLMQHVTPAGPEWDSVQVQTSKDGSVPVVNVSWKLQSDAGLRAINGSEINIRDETTNQSVCEQIHFSVYDMENSKQERWTFSLAVVVEPEHTYNITVFHFPEPDFRDYRIKTQTTVPGCKDPRIKNSQLCQENGSLWNPRIAAALSDKKDLINVEFDSAEHSESYLVSIQSGSVNQQENRTRLNVTLGCVSFHLSQYEVTSLSHFILQIQPYFIGCKNNCESAKKNITRRQNLSSFLDISLMTGSRSIKICLVFLFICCRKRLTKVSFLSNAVQERKRVLVIYSLDHRLYKNIVLKFSAFLAAKCGTDVVLDLLDSTRLGVLGSIQWLEWHKEQIERSSDKILILCSRGVQAKWRAMCGGKQVFLREDALSPIGDTLTPSLTLLAPYFIRSASFEKYIVAYFDDVCSEEDIPSPFKITVRYKLMKQFEEVFFRILNTEKHEPGRVKQISGLSEDKYHECPSGGALRDAIEAFRKYQLEHPYWFQEELLERSE
uniref:SEFIR domain-containing protein n=1 Tax=Poecilia formosa TaxID=48698 RepID=A0A087X9S9_POEFO